MVDDDSTKKDKGKIDNLCGLLIRKFKPNYQIKLNGSIIGATEAPKVLQEDEIKERTVSLGLSSSRK